MEFSFEAKVVLHLDHSKNANRANHVATDFNLECSPNLDETKYLDDGLPTDEGSKVLSNVLIQGLVANIHMAHEKKFRDSAEHLRWIISELERGFVEVTNIEESHF